MPVRYSEHSRGPSTRRAVLTPAMVEDLAYYTWTKAELKAEAESRGLPTSGTKNDLIERLQEEN